MDRQGFIRWKGRKVFISSALWGEKVELACLDGRRWAVRYGPMHLGYLDKAERELVLPRRSRKPERDPW